MGVRSCTRRILGAAALLLCAGCADTEEGGEPRGGDARTRQTNDGGGADVRLAPAMDARVAPETDAFAPTDAASPDSARSLDSSEVPPEDARPPTDGPLAADADLPEPDAAPPPPVDCAPIAERERWSLCRATATTCEAVFYDQAGCAALCEAAGLRCGRVFEDVDGQCAADRARDELSCDPPSNHQSDYCVCVAPDCVPVCEDGRECGSDGCGGDCGACPGRHGCEDGVCVPLPDDREPWEELAGRAIGYGREATGGLGGPVCWVESRDDSGAGTLRDCATRAGAKWIRFRVTGSIRLNSMINVTSNTTIDGRGVNIDIRNRGLRLSEVQNVIIHNIRFSNGGGTDEDALQIVNGARNIWIDHVTLEDFTDGLLDITVGATDVTVSWCLFRNHDKVMLISASPDHDADSAIRVTLHHNYFNETQQRHPRLRFGRVHAFNNYYRRWGSYGIGSSQRGQVFSENNVFDAGNNRTAIQNRVGDDPDRGDVRSVGDLLLNRATVQEHRRDQVFTPSDAYPYQAEPANAALRDRVSAGAGWRDTPAP